MIFVLHQIDGQDNDQDDETNDADFLEDSPDHVGEDLRENHCQFGRRFHVVTLPQFVACFFQDLHGVRALVLLELSQTLGDLHLGGGQLPRVLSFHVEVDENYYGAKQNADGQLPPSRPTFLALYNRCHERVVVERHSVVMLLRDSVYFLLVCLPRLPVVEQVQKVIRSHF